MESQTMTSPTRCSGEGFSLKQHLWESCHCNVWFISLCPIKPVLLTPHQSQWLPSPSAASSNVLAGPLAEAWVWHRKAFSCAYKFLASPANLSL